MAQSTTLVFILVARALQDPRAGVVNIPFPFRIENMDLTSGHYTVRLDHDQLRLSTTGDSKAIDCAAVTAAIRTDSACGTLAFAECGARYILCKAFWPSGWIKPLVEDGLAVAAVTEN